MKVDTSALYEQVIALVTALVAYGIYYARQQLTVRVRPGQLEVLSQLAMVAVKAAEEAGKGKGGAVKYGIAEQFLSKAASKVHLKVTPEEAHGFIHNALADYRAITDETAVAQ